VSRIGANVVYVITLAAENSLYLAVAHGNSVHSRFFCADSDQCAAGVKVDHQGFSAAKGCKIECVGQNLECTSLVILYFAKRSFTVNYDKACTVKPFIRTDKLRAIQLDRIIVDLGNGLRAIGIGHTPNAGNADSATSHKAMVCRDDTDPAWARYYRSLQIKTVITDLDHFKCAVGIAV